jgi:hypothetical protein
MAMKKLVLLKMLNATRSGIVFQLFENPLKGDKYIYNNKK